MTDAFAAAAGMAIIASIMAAMIIILRAVLKNRHGISRTAFVFIWLLVFVRACIPFGFEIGIDGAESLLPGQMIYDAVYHQVYEGQWAEAASAAGEDALRGDAAAATGLESESAVSSSAQQSPLTTEDIIKVIFAVWLMGAAVAACIFGASYVKKINQVKMLPSPVPNEAIIKAFEANKEKVRVKKAVLKLTDGRGGAVYGILRPVVLLGNEDASGADMILLHELVHIKHKDNLKKAFAFAVLSLYWFDPLMWISVRCMNRDIEMACDEKVLKILGREERKDYAGFILNSAQMSSGTAALSFFGESPVYERIKHILLIKKKQTAGPVICGALAVFMILGCFMSPVSALPDKITEALETGISSSFEGFDVPGAEKYPVTDYAVFEGGAVFLQDKPDIGVYSFIFMEKSGEILNRIDVPKSLGEYAGSMYCDNEDIYYASVLNGEGTINKIDGKTGIKHSVISVDPDISSFKLFGGEGYLCWYEGGYLKALELETGEMKGIYETASKQDYGAVLRGWTAYSYLDESTGKILVRSTRLGSDEFFETESLLGEETYSVYGNDGYIIYKEDFSRTGVYVFDRACGETRSLWDMVPASIADKLETGQWGINLLEDHIIICGEGDQVYTIDLKNGRGEELISGVEGIGYYAYKNSGRAVSTMLYASGENDPEMTGNIYIARIADSGK